VQFKSLPRADQKKLSKTDEAVATAFGAAASALFGPEAAAASEWFIHGGGKWVQESILWILPEGWVAKGAYTWIDSVIEPVRAKAIETDSILDLAGRHAYRYLLEARGLVQPDDFTPEALRWENVRDAIPDASFTTFAEYVGKIERDKGYYAYRDVYLGQSAYAKLYSDTQCRALQNGSDSFLAYCVKLEGLPNNPESSFVELVATGYAKALDAYRLQPKLDALREATANAEAVLPAAALDRQAFGSWSRRVTRTRRLRLVAAGACGIVGIASASAAAYLFRR